MKKRAGPASGVLTLRMKPETHAALIRVAEALNVDLTGLINTVISRALPGLVDEAARIETAKSRVAEMAGGRVESRPEPVGLGRAWDEEQPDFREREKARRLYESMERHAEIGKRTIAVPMIRRGGKSVEEVAAEFGVDAATVRRWINEVESEERDALANRVRSLAANGKTPAEIARALKVEESAVREMIGEEPAAPQPEETKHGGKSTRPRRRQH